MARAEGETAGDGSLCPNRAPVRRYDVAAINVEITLNRYLDYDPAGRMYVLASDVERVRAEEAANRAARQDRDREPAITAGLQGDAVQPLVLRVNQGECLRLRLENQLAGGEEASIHVHGSELVVRPGGSPAVASNPAARATPGRTVEYEWWIPSEVPEGTHYFHSHWSDREQTGHGLFGAVVVEPAGSRWADPLTGRPAPTGWAAMVSAPGQDAFREYVLMYHEIGHENYRILGRNGEFVPLVDPLLGAYRPGTRAISYRSEPFLNRLALQQTEMGRFDESVAYSSYTFGDPATPIARAYLGDRVKQRVVHGGGEVFHVHHVHGGSIRWRRQQDAEGVAGPAGLQKRPDLLPRRSERIDSQSMGPAESFDTENECGAGGCQQSAGDFLFHCHVAHHYFSGMWGIWRVYNTLQDGPASTDDLPPLRSLPGRQDSTAPGVSSERLLGTAVPDRDALTQVVEAQLPPRGLPRGYDAAVFDWQREGDVYLNEPEDRRRWPGYTPPADDRKRRPLLFDPRTTKLAFPMLRPHLGRRPPFAPNHGPAPFLDPVANGRPPPEPGESGPASLCPAGTKRKQVDIDAVPLSVPLNQRQGVVDAQGELYVLRQDRPAVEQDLSRRVPLVIRANAGEDCVDIVLRSELPDNELNHGFSKVNLHVHMVQFDVQGSDGVDTGFNYEQSVRPYTVEGERTTKPAAAGTNVLEMADARRFQAGVLVGVGMEQTETFEIHRVRSVTGNRLELDAPLKHPHRPGEIVSTEFVRYRWYPDVQFGTAFFHDHVNALQSWTHGLFGALISEPPGATYHHPRTGEEMTSGLVADVHTDKRISADVTGSFREAVTFLSDQVPINTVGRSSGGALNLRAEPLAGRKGPAELQLSSEAHGDPASLVVDAMVGDPVMFRTLVGATNDVHTWHVSGHWFRTEPHSRSSPKVRTAHLGISERFDLLVPHAGGPQRRPGDYLIANGRTSKLREGAWGILRVHPPGGQELRPLPGRSPQEPGPSGCPADSPRRRFPIAAIEADLPMLEGGKGLVYVLDDGAEGARPPEPLVLHVNIGDCVELVLRNGTDRVVSAHADGLSFDPATTGGLAVGRNPVQAVPVGGSRAYELYASPEAGETVAILKDGADLAGSAGRGLYGAIVVGPRGARYTDPVTGEDVGHRSAWAVDVHPPKGEPYRDVSLLLHDEDDNIGTHRMPYTEHVVGAAAVNYRRTPFRDLRPAVASTPVVQAHVGDRVRVNVVVPRSEQNQVFGIEGHEWPLDPGLPRSTRVSAIQVGAWEAMTLHLRAGGEAGRAGDYEYGNHREPFREAGMWGRFLVGCPGDIPVRALEPDRASAACRTESNSSVVGSATPVALALGLAGLLVARRRRLTRRPAA